MLTVGGGESWEQAGGLPSDGTKGLTIPSGTTSIILWAWTNNANHGIEPSSVSLGGVAATYIGEGDPFPAAYSVHAWEILDISARSNDTLSWAAVNFQDQLWAVAYVDGGGSPAQRVTWGAAVGATSPTGVSLNPGSIDDCLGLIGGANDGTANLANIGPGSGQTEIVEAATSLAGDAVINVSYLNDIDSTTTVEFTHNNPGPNCAGIGVLLAAGATVADTGTIGAEFGWQDGVEAFVSEDVSAHMNTNLGAEFGWQKGVKLRAGGKRQVALVGGKVHTSEMTEGGDEGQVLTQHADAPPSWEDAGSPTLDWAEDGDITTLAFGDTPLAGPPGESAQAPHRHGMPADPVTAHEAAGDPHPAYRLESDPIDHGATTGLGDDDHTQYIKDSEFGAKGRILVGTASGTFDDLPVGTDGQVLTADSAEATGAKWDDPSGGSALTVEDESQDVQVSSVDTIVFPDGTVVDLGSGNVSVREVPSGAIGAKAYHSTTQGSLAALTYNPLDMDSEEWDTDGFHSTSSNTSRMTIPAHLTGARDYLVIARTYVASALAIPYLRKNGTTLIAGGSDSNDQPIDIAVVVRASPGDYFEFTPLHTTGTRTAGSASAQELRTEMSISLLGSGNVAALPSARARRASSNLTLNSTEWANVDTGLDLVVPAQAGDVHLVSISALWGAEAVVGFLDAASIVSGSPVNYVSGGGGASDAGIAGLFGSDATSSATLNLPSGAAVQYVVQAGDISGGTVTYRLRYRTGSASNKTLFATTAIPLQWSVVNFKGGGAAAKVCRVIRITSAQSISADTWTAVEFNGETHDTDAFHSTSSNTTRLTAPVTGWYQVDADVEFGGAGGSSNRRVGLRANGSAYWYIFAGPFGTDTQRTMLHVGGPVYLVAGEYVEVMAYSGAAVAVAYDGDIPTNAAIHFIGS